MNEPEDILGEIESDVERVFTPRPGGMIDRYHQEKARREAAEKRREQEEEHVEQAAYRAVKTAQEMPETLVTNVIPIQPGATQMVLPNSSYRYRATIIATAVTVPTVNPILAKDSSQALGGAGFPLPMNTPFIVNARAQLWVGNPASNAVTISISVLSEIYAPEK
jgi:hypothetical protein